MPTIETKSVSVIIPTYNGATRIGACLQALTDGPMSGVEIVVVDDGSTDNTVEVAERYPGVRVMSQPNRGPAAARNLGAREACGAILMFTDDDCIPTRTWLHAMLAPFEDPDVVGAKGVYRTHQTSLIARFVQIEYEDRYRIMMALPRIDFIDTYSAAYLRDRFLEMGGYDDSFPVACAEDVELSYRMSGRNWKMKFAPLAAVFHTHPDKLGWYLRKKFKFAFWRVVALRKNPTKAVKDSHTPQIMKMQLLFAPALSIAVALDVAMHRAFVLSLIVAAGFVTSTLPFAIRASRKDVVIGLLSPALLAARACAQFLGVVGGVVHARRTSFAGSGGALTAEKQVKSLRARYVLQLRSLLSVEQQTMKGLQRMSEYANDPDFKAALRMHFGQTEVHIARLVLVLAQSADNALEDATDGFVLTMLRSADRLIEELEEGSVRDAALIATARTIEHYEIACYSTVFDWATHLGLGDHAETLQTTLLEEKQADQILSALSQSTLLSVAA